VPLLEVDVSHRVRRGAFTEGTTWRRGARSPIPTRLVRFSVQALLDSLRFRQRLAQLEHHPNLQATRVAPFVTAGPADLQRSRIDGDPD
jgi:hypothetical protein